MKNSSLWTRTIIIIAVTVVGIYLVIGPRTAPSAGDFSWEGVKRNLAGNISLGLDLKGGSHLVMRVKTDEYLKTLTENNAQAATLAVKDANLAAGEAVPKVEGGAFEVSIEVKDAEQVKAVIDEVTKKVDFVTLWTESVSGSTVTWSLPLQAQNRLKEQATDQALKIIESRIDAFGVKEPTLQRHGSATSGQILLQMPGLDDPERVKKLIGDESELALMKVHGEGFQTFSSEAEAVQTLGGTVPFNKKVLPYVEREDDGTAAPADRPKSFVIVDYPPIVEGSELRDASAFSRTGGDSNYEINFSLKPAGAQKFGEWTGRNIGKNLAIVLNGEVKSAPVVQGQIFDSGQITGNFSKQSAEDLALTLKSGALPAKLEYQEERTVGPSLGADSIASGVRASVGGLVFVVIFMVIYYRGSGINAVVALVLNMMLTLAALVMLDSTLTLPGIAGLILGIGMAVDSNVLIFERMREEIRAGVEVRRSVERGFDRAFITIIDTHVTTIIAAVILYMYGSGPIRGFAVTLILGLLINLFSAVFVSRTIFMWLLHRNPGMAKVSI
jgi:preprotein translocase subunit SecD